VRAEQAHRWNGDIWLVIKLPDGYRGRVRLSETDLGDDDRPEQFGSTTLSAEGVRALMKLVARLNDRLNAIDAP